MVFRSCRFIYRSAPTIHEPVDSRTVMNIHIPNPPLAYEAQTQAIDSIEAVLWDHYTGNVGHIKTIATINAIITEYRQ